MRGSSLLRTCGFLVVAAVAGAALTSCEETPTEIETELGKIHAGHVNRGHGHGKVEGEPEWHLDGGSDCPISFNVDPDSPGMCIVQHCWFYSNYQGRVAWIARVKWDGEGPYVTLDSGAGPASQLNGVTQRNTFLHPDGDDTFHTMEIRKLDNRGQPTEEGIDIVASEVSGGNSLTISCL